jgi:hypothetical protein
MLWEQKRIPLIQPLRLPDLGKVDTVHTAETKQFTTALLYFEVLLLSGMSRDSRREGWSTAFENVSW